MDLVEFLRSRQPRWERLAVLLDRIESHEPSALTAAEADEFFALYRWVSSDLNLVQTRTGNPALLEYLEGLVGRAYAVLAVPRRGHLLRAWWRIVRHDFPARVRREIGLLVLAAAAMLAGAALGFFATLPSDHAAEMFLPPEHLAQSPSERVRTLEDMEKSGSTRIGTASEYTVFSTFLFTHNIRVSVLCFALGLTFGIGTVVLLFFNGAMVGSLAALYLRDGEMLFFVAWIAPHGVIELPCVLLAGASGLMLARAQLRRDAGTTFSQIRALRPALIDMLVGTATLLVVAGAIEGGFSQINEPVLPYPLKIAVAAGLLAALALYLFALPVRPAAGGAADGAISAATPAAAS
jgi:uncharacterized membrane protein SpoIIM required for sporulation